jgi:hypothetical protein
MESQCAFIHSFIQTLNMNSYNVCSLRFFGKTFTGSTHTMLKGEGNGEWGKTVKNQEAQHQGESYKIFKSRDGKQDF